jgi:trehalose 6-phosphate phosphatase
LLDASAKLDVEHFLDELAQSSKALLLLDYDGTLAPFQINRQSAFPYPGVSGLVQQIMNTDHTRVVVITGRPSEEIGPLFGVTPRPEIWGAQGLQRLKPDGSYSMPSIEQSVLNALEEANDWLKELELGDLAELKPGSLAVHWRGVQDSAADGIRRRVELKWSTIAEDAHMIVQEFDGGLEIRMSTPNKGDAVRAVVAEVDSETPVAYLGDDQTDEDAFRALHGRGLRILVRPEWRESDADVWLRPPEELINFLFQWLAICRGTRSAMSGGL